jgi:hypothetical protein
VTPQAQCVFVEFLVPMSTDGFRAARKRATCSRRAEKSQVGTQMTTLVEIAHHGDADLRFPTQLKIDDQLQRSTTGESGLEDRRKNVSADHRVGLGTAAGKSGSTGLRRQFPARKWGPSGSELITKRDCQAS